MSLFHKNSPRPIDYDREKEEPVIRRSICTGEATAGFVDLESGHFRDIQVVRSPLEIREFCERTGIDPEKIRTIY